jgi:hypothetical protein
MDGTIVKQFPRPRLKANMGRAARAWVFEPVSTHSRPTFTFDFLITADLFITAGDIHETHHSLLPHGPWPGRAAMLPPWRRGTVGQDRHHHGHVSPYADIDGPAGAKWSVDRAGSQRQGAGTAVEVLSALTLEQGRRRRQSP